MLRRSCRTVVIRVALGVLVTSIIGTRVEATCNAIPATQSWFRAGLDTSIDRPFASPDDIIAIRRTLPPASRAQQVLPPNTAVVATVVFTPPNGPRHAVVLAPSQAHCDQLRLQLEHCGERLASPTPACVPDPALIAAASDENADPPASIAVQLRFPTTVDVVPSGLAGPTTLAVTTVADALALGLPCGLGLDQSCLAPPPDPPLLACVDRLFADDGSSPPNPGETFANFTALPPPNVYRGLCHGPSCAAGTPAPSLFFAVDTGGNVLVPFNWNGIVEGVACRPQTDDEQQRQVVPTTARLVQGFLHVSAFAGSDEMVAIPSQTLVRSFTSEGRALAPIFDAHLTPSKELVTIFGFVDGCRSVLRIARRDPTRPSTCRADPDETPCETDDDCAGRGSAECGPALFEFRDRMRDGVGPIVVPERCQPDPEAGAECYDFTAGANVPLDGVHATADLIAFTVPEPSNATDLNDDGDEGDEVLAVAVRASGTIVNTQRAVARVGEGPLSHAAVAAHDDMVALLEPESAQKRDANGDRDVRDLLLRVLASDGHDVREVGTPRAAALEPVVNEQSLAWSNGLLVYRTASAANVLASMSNPAGAFHFIEGASRQPSIVSPFGATEIAFVSAGPPPNSGDVNGFDDIYRAHLVSWVYFGGPAATVSGPLSRGPDGAPANGPSSEPAFAQNGYAIAFTSAATNLVSNQTDRNGASDVFLRVVDFGDVELISSSLSGEPAGGASASPSISADSRYVAFESTATDLVPDDVGARSNVFVRDRCRQDLDRPVADCIPVTELVSLDDCGAPGDGDSWGASISADGRYVAFASDATNLIGCGSDGGDTNGVTDVFVRDRCLGAPGCTPHTERASVRLLTGGGPSAPAVAPALSGDGRFIAFVSAAADLVDGDDNGLADVFVHDRCLGDPGCTPHTERVSVSSRGEQADGSSTGRPAISFDGAIVAFTSSATNLVGDDDRSVCPGFATPGSCPDVFVRDRWLGITERASQPTKAADADGASGEPSLTSDGRQMAFASTATNLAPREPDRFPDDNDASDIFLRGAIEAAPFLPQLGVLDTDLSAAATPIDGRCPARQVVAAGDYVAFLRPEDSDQQCPSGAPGAYGAAATNGDKDNDDDVVHVWAPKGRGTVHNFRCAARAIAASPEWIAALVAEADQGDRDLNGDNDTVDVILKVHALGNAPTSCDAWREVRDARRQVQVADAVSVVDSMVAFLTPESALDPRLDHDGNRPHRILQLYDIGHGLQNVGQPALDFVLGHRFVAFRTRELDLCQNAAGAIDCRNPQASGCGLATCNLNGDGDSNDTDCCDDVLQVYDFANGFENGCLMSTQRAVVPCDSPACDTRVPYRVGDNTVTFLTPTESGYQLETFNERSAYEACLDRTASGEKPSTACACDPSAPLVRRRAGRNRTAAKPTPYPLAAVYTGICSGDEKPCARDESCEGGGTCVVPPLRCVEDIGSPCRLPGMPANGRCSDTSAACTGDAECKAPAHCVVPQCEADQFCAPSTASPALGTCRRIAMTDDGTSPQSCSSDANCRAGARCRSAQHLIGPLVSNDPGAPVFVSAGQCIEVDPDQRVIVHGSCVTDADCPSVAGTPITCHRNLIAATAADTDGDEIADPFDNCPTVANPVQENSDGNGPGDACEVPGCPATPMSGCVTASAGDASLVIDLARRPALTWKWKGPRNPAFGSPLQHDTYALCLYAGGNGPDPHRRLQLSVPASGPCKSGRCWKSDGTRGFSYRDRRAHPIGISRVALRTSKRGAKIHVAAHGAGLLRSALPLGTRVTAQLIDLGPSGGHCWEATHGQPEGPRNAAEVYRATSE